MASSHITSSSDVAAGDDNIDKTDTKNKGLRDQQASEVIEDTAPDEADFRVYKRRFLGLGQLVLLNIVVSWDVSLFPCCTPAARPLRTAARMHSHS